jgi:hypothetical protein
MWKAPQFSDAADKHRIAADQYSDAILDANQRLIKVNDAAAKGIATSREIRA